MKSETEFSFALVRLVTSTLCWVLLLLAAYRAHNAEWNLVAQDLCLALACNRIGG